MRGNDRQAKGIGPVPVLFVTVGRRADQTVAALSQAVQDLTVPVQGPFGLLSVDPGGGRLAVRHWTWLSDFDAPTSSERVDPSSEALPAAVASLVRTLQSKEPVADPSRPGRLRMSSYVLIDLSQPDSVERALHVMKLLRKADPAHDMALVALTGRTAASGCELDEVWFQAWTQLTARLQEELLAQKVYLLDGRNAAGTWFERPEQMDRFCAEFLLLHGVTCRGALRQNERRRISPQENLLNVCGSFGLRVIRLDLPQVIERTAYRLVHEDLRTLYEEVLSDERRRYIDEEAQALAERIEGIYEAEEEACGGEPERSATAAYELAVHNEDACEAIAATAARACGRAPLASLCHLLRCLEPRLRRMLTRQKLMERRQVRHRVAEALREQEERTYQPMRVWLDQCEAGWADRFTPIKEIAPEVSVSRPVGRAAWRFGLVFLATGLAGIAAGLFFQDRIFVFGGALLALAASVLATQPTGWTKHRRAVIPEGRDVDKSAPIVSYRKRASSPVRCLAMVLGMAGIVAVVWSLWPDLWTTGTWRAGASVLLAVVGLSAIVSGPVQVRSDQPKRQEATGHLSPPFWTWRAFGLLCIASAWSILSLWAPHPLQDDAALRWAGQVGGLLLIGGAAVLGLKPRIGRVRLVERVPKVPEPLTGGISVSIAESDLVREVTAMVQWIGRLRLDPRQGLLRHGMSDSTDSGEVLFDFVTPEWEQQLAEAFRHTLRSRMGQTLRDLALEPRAWAQCVVRHLQDPQAQSPDLGVLFTLEVVKVWIDSLSVVDLAACLDVDEERLSTLLGRSTSPNWPATRAQPDVNISVVAVGSSLWEALAPLNHTGGPSTMVCRDWDGQTEDVLVLEIVQGLSQGWRGYPALPGQRCEQRLLGTIDSTPSSVRRASSQAS